MPFAPPPKTRKRHMKPQEEKALSARKEKTSLEDLSMIIYYFFRKLLTFKSSYIFLVIFKVTIQRSRFHYGIIIYVNKYIDTHINM